MTNVIDFKTGKPIKVEDKKCSFCGTMVSKTIVGKDPRHQVCFKCVDKMKAMLDNQN